MKCGYVLYKCRICSEVLRSYASDDWDNVWADFINHKYPLTSYHQCKPNPLDLEFPANAVKGGVLDLIGILEDEKVTV